MSLDQMIRAKNAAILELRNLIAQDDKRAALPCAIAAAGLEEQITEYYLARGKHEDAVVNLISQASCLKDADDPAGAARVLQRAQSLTRIKSVSDWIEAQLTETPSRRAKTSEIGIARPLSVFFSYSRRDEKLRVELEKHLAPLMRSGQIEVWHDRKLRPGDSFEEEIDRRLETSDIVLLLVTPDFLASDYCYGREMKIAIDRHLAGDAQVIPIITRPVDWHSTPLGNLLALPAEGKPVTSWPRREEALLDVARGVRRAVDELQARKPTKLRPVTVPERRGPIRRRT